MRIEGGGGSIIVDYDRGDLVVVHPVIRSHPKFKVIIDSGVVW